MEGAVRDFQRRGEGQCSGAITGGKESAWAINYFFIFLTFYGFFLFLLSSIFFWSGNSSVASGLLIVSVPGGCCLGAGGAPYLSAIGIIMSSFIHLHSLKPSGHF